MILLPEMEITDNTFFQKSDALRSGKYYAVKAIQRCYRINEPDHFLKDIKTIFFGYLNEKEQFHHFNRPGSVKYARTPISSIFALEGLNSVEFYELREEALPKITSPSLSATKSEKESSISELVIKKTLDAFENRSDGDAGVVFLVEELKRKHQKEYLTPPDLAH